MSRRRQRQRQGGRPAPDLYALVSADGLMYGATPKRAYAYSLTYWHHVADLRDLEDLRLALLSGLPQDLAEDLLSMGGRSPWYTDGHEAWRDARPYLKGPLRPLV